MSDVLTLHLRYQVLMQDAGGHNLWQEVVTERTVPALETAIIICDMWDHHWSRGAEERVGVIAPRMNRVIAAARERGVTVIHAPSDTMAFYASSPARKRVLATPLVDPPAPLERADWPLPIDASDGGSDTGETPWYKAWTRQHPALVINEVCDGISDNGTEVYRYLVQRGIRTVLIMGVHTNMCVLNRSFAIKALVRWGLDVALVRDLTDTMYNPAMSPYVSHDEGTALVVGYIERFWCPTVLSKDLIGSA